MGTYGAVDDGTLVGRGVGLDMRRFWMLGLVLGLAALVFAVLFGARSASRARPNAAMSSTGLHSSSGRLTVDYTVEDAPNSTVSASMDDVTDIAFQPSYIAVRTMSGRGLTG